MSAELTDEQLRVAVAENQGWFSMGQIAGRPGWGCATDPKHPFAANKFFIEALPNYPASLDACAEFEGTLKDYQIGIYQDWVKRLVPNPPEYVGGFFALITASPRIRCLAYLMTVAPERLKG